MREPERIQLARLILETSLPGRLFRLSHRDDEAAQYDIATPSFEVEGRERAGFIFAETVAERTIARGGREVILRYRDDDSPRLDLLVTLRAYEHSSLLRLRYRLSSDTDVALTKGAGQDRIRYLSIHGNDLAACDLTDIQLSHFDPVAHCYMPYFDTRRRDELFDGLSFAGPIALLHSEHRTVLVAYEHGADHPHAFLEFLITESKNGRGLTLAARKGNYYHGQRIGPTTSWESVWLELGLAPETSEEFLQLYRRFFLEEIAENVESRKPYLYYNTWNFQERNRYFNGRPYLETMTYERIMAEIEVAHRLGIDVFVIDTGWYGKTGDWQVNLERFPDGLHDIKRKLDGYGMQLGLWFNPTVAALSSEIHLAHPEYVMTRDGRRREVGPVWETEESVAMCLASDYADYFIETMVRLHHDLGVTYFKWDGISQYGCDSPAHHHGMQANSIEERAECYAYQMGRQMIRIVEETTARCPQVIVDFDITEAGRFVGLGFLSVGKYFLINNGPYFSDFDIPPTVRIEPDTINVFFYPGSARPRVCRQGIKYDPAIPSILFLTHYLPDPPQLAQRNSLAALVLGGNGIWGDLLSLGKDDIAVLGGEIADYKRVADGVTRSFPHVRGFPGSSPEVYEKIDRVTANGVVVFFTVTPGTFIHLTQPLTTAQSCTVKGADSYECTPDHRLKLSVRLDRNDARIVYVFGATDNDAGTSASDD